MVFSNVIADVTIPRHSFVSGQSRSKVSAGFTNVSGLAVAAFDLVYCSLSVLRFVFVLDISIISLLEYFFTVCLQYCTSSNIFLGTYKQHFHFNVFELVYYIFHHKNKQPCNHKHNLYAFDMIR